MTNTELLDMYINMHHGIIFDKLINVKSVEAAIAFCAVDEDTNWNFALVKEILSEQQIDKLE